MSRHEIQIIFGVTSALLGAAIVATYSYLDHKRRQRLFNQWLDQAKREHRL